MNKRYLIFQWNDCDERGGTHDLRTSFDTQNEVQAYIASLSFKSFKYGVVQVFDCDTRALVFDSTTAENLTEKDA